MKKFIAALLSAMVGIFGYTITDITVDERIATLEAEVAELREDEGSSGSSGGIGTLEVGDYLKLAPTSNTKFLFRENENGKLNYITPANVDEIKEDDIFIYVTDAVCQITGFETITHSVDYGKNYEPSSISLKSPTVSLTLKGSAPESLAGKQLKFKLTLSLIPTLTPSPGNEISCLVSSDGSFSFSGDLALNPMFNDLVMEQYHYNYNTAELEDLFNGVILMSDTFTISTPEIS